MGGGAKNVGGVGGGGGGADACPILYLSMF